MTPSLDQLAEGVRSGRQRDVARAISLVENGQPERVSLLHRLYDPLRSFRSIGVTGPSGAGKSTLVDRLVSAFRNRDARTGIIAVDPSSPFTGGALLGDRLRMAGHNIDSEVFIRSMGSRGHLGGVSGATRDATEILSAAGYDPVIIETVGAGQSEVEVAEVADIVLLVLVPGYGDDIQTMKAGLMEIGDVIVLNKSDRPDIDDLERNVRASLELIPEGGRVPPVIRCSALSGEGIPRLMEAIESIRTARAHDASEIADRARMKLRHVVDELGTGLARETFRRVYESEQEVLDRILAGETSPYVIGEEILASVLGNPDMAGDADGS